MMESRKKIGAADKIDIGKRPIVCHLFYDVFDPDHNYRLSSVRQIQPNNPNLENLTHKKKNGDAHLIINEHHQGWKEISIYFLLALLFAFFFSAASFAAARASDSACIFLPMSLSSWNLVLAASASVFNES